MRRCKDLGGIAIHKFTWIRKLRIQKKGRMEEIQKQLIPLLTIGVEDPKMGGRQESARKGEGPFTRRSNIQLYLISGRKNP